MIPKLSRVCYAIRSVSHISSTNTLKSFYFIYFHSIMKYEIIFGGKSPKLLELLLVSNLEIHEEIYS
jgi:hypothetical protein